MRILTAVSLSLAVASFARAATVTVLRPDGRPAPAAVVMCSGYEKAAVTGDDGAATVPDDCGLATCTARGYLSGWGEIVAGHAKCRLIAGVQVILRLDDSRCGERCIGALVPVAHDGDRPSREFEDVSDSSQPEARLDVVKTGAYTVQVSDGDGWVCRMSVELRPTGEEIVPAVWRPPLELRGVVIGDDGAPAADIPVRVRAAEGGSDSPLPAWTCSRYDHAPDLFSAEDGSFVVPIDPVTGGAIEAGSSWDPDGFASVAVAAPWPSSVTLRLKRRR